MILQVIEVGEVGGAVLIVLGHRRVEAIALNADAFAEYRCLECQWRQVTFELIDERLAEHLHIVDGGCLTVVGSHRAHTAQVTVECAQLRTQPSRDSLALSNQCFNLLLDAPHFIYRTLYQFNQFRVALVLILQEPRTLLGHRHIAGDEHAVVEVVLTEVLTVATISRQRLILQLLEVDELGFVDVERVVRLRVRCAASVL